MTERNEAQKPLVKNKHPSPEKQEYQQFVRQVIRKLVIDLQQGGFYQEASENRRHYWVALQGKSQQQYASLLDAQFEEGLITNVNLGAGDLNKPIGEKRSLILGLLKLDTTKSFSDPSLEGAYLFSIERITEDAENEPLSGEEGIAFLNELLNAEIDQEETEKRFEEVRQESSEWSIYRAQEGPLLALESSEK